MKCVHCGQEFDDAQWTEDDMLWKPVVEGYLNHPVQIDVWMSFCPQCRIKLIEHVRKEAGR